MLNEASMRAIIRYLNQQNNDVIFRFPQLRKADHVVGTIKPKIDVISYLSKLADASN